MACSTLSASTATLTPSRGSPGWTLGRQPGQGCENSTGVLGGGLSPQVPLFYLLAHDLYDDPLLALPIELGVVDLLPWTHIEAAVGHGNDDLMVQEKVLQVGVAVRLACPMVPVVVPVGGQSFEPLVDILDQPILGIVDTDRGTRVRPGGHPQDRLQLAGVWRDGRRVAWQRST